MSFDAHKILVYAWPPTHMLPSARFSADLKQLQNRDFSTSNSSKPIWVLTRTKCSCSDDRLPMGYLLPDFQPIWSNFLNHFSLTRQKGGRHERGFGLFLKELNIDSLNCKLESYCVQTKQALAIGCPSCTYHLRYPLGLGAKLLFFSQLKILRLERDVVAFARSYVTLLG